MADVGRTRPAIETTEPKADAVLHPTSRDEFAALAAPPPFLPPFPRAADAGAAPPPVGGGAVLDGLSFMFATGVEGSSPVTTGGRRVDQFEATGHYDRWRQDLDLVVRLGVRHLRWGPAAYRAMAGPGRYDFDFCDRVLEGMAERGITPILDLLHFGLPDWLGDFQNPEWPAHFADYAHAVARRYPHVRLYTPVNEMFVTAQFSAAFGWWNERLRSDAAFVRNLAHCATASHAAMRAILAHRPDAAFVFSESTEHVHAGHPSAAAEARWLNERRFLPLDLLLGHGSSPAARDYLHLALSPGEHEAILAEGSALRGRCILGTDYYVTNEHLLLPGGRMVNVEDVFGYYSVARQYYDRYRVPLMHTETNRAGGGAGRWMWKQWMNLLRLRDDGVPVVGFTWFGLTDMTDWDTALRQVRGRVCPVGLYTLDRKPRAVSREFKRLVKEAGDLPVGYEADAAAMRVA